jgi:hypothetical protein
LVVSGSPVDIWAVNRYGSSHHQESIRKQHGVEEDDVVILVVGSYMFFDELPWDYAKIMRASAPQILDTAKTKSLRVQFIFFCGDNTDAYNSAFQVMTILKVFILKLREILPKHARIPSRFNGDIYVCLQSALKLNNFNTILWSKQYCFQF